MEDQTDIFSGVFDTIVMNISDLITGFLTQLLSSLFGGVLG